MNNAEFLRAIEKSFKAFIESGSSRSTAKLCPLHGAIAKDIHERLGDEYSIQSLGYAQGKEGKIQGHYIDKRVDILISKNGRPISGIAVKFVMQNYSQNSGNYFESMLGETANIRYMHYPYFQLLILPQKMPHYKDKGKISHWEKLSEKLIHKYRILDADTPKKGDYSPDKMLIYVVQIPDAETEINVDTKQKYFEFCQTYFREHPAGFMNVSDFGPFRNLVIHNDYEAFAEKVYHKVKSR